MEQLPADFRCQTAIELGISNTNLRCKYVRAAGRLSSGRDAFIYHHNRIICRHLTSRSPEGPRPGEMCLSKCFELPGYHSSTRPKTLWNESGKYLVFKYCRHAVDVPWNGVSIHVRCLPQPWYGTNQLVLVCAGRRARRHYLPPELHELIAEHLT